MTKTLVQFDINGFAAKVQAKTKNRVTYTELADAAGKKRYAIQSMASNQSYQDFLAMLGALIDYAKENGVNASLEDLFTVTNEPGTPPTS